MLGIPTLLLRFMLAAARSVIQTSDGESVWFPIQTMQFIGCRFFDSIDKQLGCGWSSAQCELEGLLDFLFLLVIIAHIINQLFKMSHVYSATILYPCLIVLR